MRFAALSLVAFLLAACLVSTWAEPGTGRKKPSSPRDIPKVGGGRPQPSQFTIPNHTPPQGGSSSGSKPRNPNEPRKIIHGFQIGIKASDSG
ncbi:Amiloride-sensitive sodium channel subunit delta [Frankliniella fusca]|uniref:Amiloride-sensitive sodium channel subunit delta n=1 Tax=Frankliniella fusca TaxID=407009 RepID=A0AAE1GUQ4_9NEOP|nr:Amiloride-sensitive sodium channel subunit delta [Frankliniella fusca]